MRPRLATLTLVIAALSAVTSGSLFGSTPTGPFKSDTLYLEDYCVLPDGVEITIQHTERSGHDSDHDHNNDIETAIEQIDNLIAKGIRRVNKFIQLQQKYNERFHDLELDALEQPSMAIRLWRKGHNKIGKLHRKILKRLHLKDELRCRVLLKLKEFDETTQAKLGTVLNFVNMAHKSWQNEYRLRVVTSNANMTQYWVEGRRLLQEVILAAKKGEKALPIEVDLADDPLLDVSPAERKQMNRLLAAGQNFVLLEMKLLSETEREAAEQTSKGKVVEDDNESTELVVNVYETTQRYVLVEKDENEKNADGSAKLKTTPIDEADIERLPANATVEVINECPKGTFDCFANGLQCIPNYLRCNGEDNCGNGFDEIFQCSSITMYFAMGIDPYHSERDIFNASFWLAIKFLLLVTFTVLTLYLVVGLIKCCFTCKRRRGYISDDRFPAVYFNKNATRSNSLKQPLLAQSGYENIRPPTPPPSYFGAPGTGNGMDNKGSTINEYIYVNNNYGQPQGGTYVRPNIAPNQCTPSSADVPTHPPGYQNMYPAFNVPSAPTYYGSAKKQ